MSALAVQQSITEQWLRLVSEAEHAAHCRLDHDLESYLVFLLMRYTNQPEMAGEVLALEYLRSMLAAGARRREGLRDVGDKCLLYSGLFPRRAQRRRVRISYFVDLGRGAYHQLAEHVGEGAAITYRRLATGFVSLMEVLQQMRELGDPQARLTPLDAYELWSDTASEHAYRSLRAQTDADAFLVPQATSAAKPRQ